MALKKIVVTGTREKLLDSDREKILAALSFELCGAKEREVVIAHGDCQGVDRYINDWANERGIHTAAIPALWRCYGNSAGPLRNEIMLQLISPSIVLAFPRPESKGTRHCIEVARKLGLIVRVTEIGETI